jgi:peptidoglycan/xylan/chitin deacetylase (PgdA/CDA1 family)
VSGRSTIAVLAYHKVGDFPPNSASTWFYVPEQLFADHLATLQFDGWTVLDLYAFISALAQATRLPQKLALITFDDAYQSLCGAAARLLQQHKFPSVVFAPTAFIGKTNSFDQGLEPEEAICSWAELKMLERCGMRVEPHGVSHRRFSELNVAERRRELTDAKTVIEKEFRRAACAFAYPYGDAGPQSGRAELKEAGYDVAFGYGGGLVELPVPDRFFLPRIAIGADTELRAALADAVEAKGYDAPST